jgi:Zn-dependent protease
MGASTERLIFMVVFFPLFLVSIMAHEVAHGYAALRAGDPTARLAGRLSFNPIVHIDPIGLLFFLMSAWMGVGFGWAKPVPINPMHFKNYRKDIIVVSLAGVAANFALVILAVIFIKILIVTGVMHFHNFNFAAYTRSDKYLLTLLMRFVALNAVLIVFNLIPIPPLDGSKVLMMILPRGGAMAVARLGQYGFLILFLLLMTHALDFLFYGALDFVMFFAYHFFAL